MAKEVTKQEFIRLAPIYYAVGIASALRETFEYTHKYDILTKWWENEDDFVNEYCYLRNEVLFDEAVKWLIRQNMLEELPDPFGPTAYKAGEQLHERWQELSQDRQSPFYKFNNMPAAQEWLQRALRRLNDTFVELMIDAADFEEEEADDVFAVIEDVNPDAEWAPIPLSRDDEALQVAIGRLDAAIAEIRAENGYAANVPEERDFVVDALNKASNHLKTAATVSVPFLRQYVVVPLGYVLRRFKDAALSVSASAAREAIIEFIKRHGEQLLDALWKHF